jgi:hypothetical protein
MPEFTDFSRIGSQQHAMQQEPGPTFEEAWARIKQQNNVVNAAQHKAGPSIQELIEQARERLAAGGTKAVDGEELPTVEAGDPATVKQIHALAAEAKQAEKEAAAQYELYKQVLKDMLGPEEQAAERLTVNGAEVATWKRSTTVILNQVAIKAQFPRDQFPELYIEQERRTFLLK